MLNHSFGICLFAALTQCAPAASPAAAPASAPAAAASSLPAATGSAAAAAPSNDAAAHFDQVSEAARVDGILNTHTFIDGTAERLAAARKRTNGQPNPFLIGTANAHRYHEILGECVAAALARLDQAPKKQAAN